MSREKQLEETVRCLWDRLTGATVALAAIDDMVDPLDRQVLTDHWGIATVCAQAQREIFEPLQSPFPVNADKNQQINVRELEAFQITRAELRKVMAARADRGREAA